MPYLRHGQKDIGPSSVVTQFFGASSHTPEGCDSIPSQATYLGCMFGASTEGL